MTRIKDIINQGEIFSVYTLSFLLPLQRNLIPIAIITYSVIFILNGGLKKLLTVFTEPYIRIMLSFYLILILGMIYTDQVSAGYFDLEVKMSLAIFPLLISSTQLSSRQIKNIFFCFIIGCLIASIICIVTAFIIYSDTKDLSVFYYDQLSLFQHPSYYALYLNFCIACIYYYLVIYLGSNKKWFEYLLISLIPVFTLTVVLLSSKMGLITLIGVVFFGSFFWFLKSRAVFPSILIFTLLTSIILTSFKFSTLIQSRVDEAIQAVSKDEVTFTTTGARILIWKTGIQLFSDSPVFGYGTGDVKSELIKKYVIKKYDHLIEHKLNAHNQYLQVSISLGILGLLVFLCYLYYPVFKYGLRLNLVYLVFIALISINFLVESMLETQAGVVFYAFFNSLLYFNRDKFRSLSIGN